jgi:hypothetical protein
MNEDTRELRRRLTPEGQEETRVGAIEEVIVELGEEADEAEYSGPVAKRKKGTGLSGWCLPSMDTDSHERCLVTVGSFTCTCACANHGTRAHAAPKWQEAPPIPHDDEYEETP